MIFNRVGQIERSNRTYTNTLINIKQSKSMINVILGHLKLMIILVARALIQCGMNTEQGHGSIFIIKSDIILGLVDGWPE